METLADIVQRWDLGGHTPLTGGSYSEIYKRISFFHLTQYYQYIPTLSADHGEFENRLRKWLTNVTDESIQRTLFEVVPNLAFFSREDFSKLYQVALEGPIIRWIVDELGVAFETPGFEAMVRQEAVQHTWYCPITDSMPISDFHHANHIGGIDFRPDWRSLAKFGDSGKIVNFMRNREDAAGNAVPLKRIVLLEDFVGSGTQMHDAIRFVASLPGHVPVLLLPLIICPAGAQVGQHLAANYSQITYSPVIELKSSDMVTAATPNDGTFKDHIADSVRTTYATVVGDDSANPRPYDPFGFPPGAGTGACVVLYSNTPANTLPIIQHTSNTWTALFPRSARIQ